MKSTKIKTKTEKGITLIALIITIVVLLILAVVAINSIQNDGILSHTGNVANTYNQSVLNEQQQLQNYLDYLDKANGSSANNPGSDSEGGLTEGTTYAAYTVGQEVKVVKDGVEHKFYVIENSDETKGTVLLLTKEGIVTDKEDSDYLTQSSSANTTVFSETNYWYTEGTTLTYPYDLTETGEPDASHYAARAAYDYGAKVGGTGRLMTYPEAETLLKTSTNEAMIYGIETGNSNGALWYWLGTAGGYNTVSTVVGGDEMLGGMNFDMDAGVLVTRPVVEISKDLVDVAE